MASVSELEVPEGGEATFTIKLSQEPTAASAVISYLAGARDDSPTSNLTLSPESLTFNRNEWNVAQTVTVTAKDEDLLGDKRFVIRATYAVPDTRASVEVTVKDNDDLAPTFGNETVADRTFTQYAAVDLTLPEASGGDGTLTYALTGTLPAGLTFDAATRKISGRPTATQAATDYTWTVTDGDATDPDSASLTFRITVNAPPPGVTLLETALTVAEADDTQTTSVEEHKATYRVVLNTDPGDGATVTVTPASSAIGTATVTLSGGASALSFTGGTSGTWDEPQTVTVTAVDDDLDNAGNRRTATVTHAVSGYSGVSTAPSVTVTVTDDDEPMIAPAVAPVAGSGTALDVSWTTVAGAGDYLVQWKTGSGDFGAGAAVTTLTHRITGLTAGTTYTVKVTARDTSTDPATELVSGQATGATHSPLLGLAFDPTASSATSLGVSWTATPGAASYRVRWRTSSETDFPSANTANPTAARYTITGLAADTTYTFEVTAIVNGSADNPDGLSSRGSARTFRALAGLDARPVDFSNSALDVSWESVSGAQGYLVQWKTGSESYSTTRRFHEVTGGATTARRIAGLTPGATYQVRVTSRHRVGGSLVGRATGEVTGTANPMLPGLAVTPVAGSTTALDVRWTQATGARGYRVEWKRAWQSYVQGGSQDLDLDTTSHRITGLVAGAVYDVRVTAYHDVSGSLLPRDVDEARQPTFGALTGLTVAAVAGADSQLEVSWNRVAGASGYVVQWKSGDEEYATASRRVLKGANDTSHRIGSLASDTAHDVRVTARVNVGDTTVDGDSDEASAATHRTLSGLAVSAPAGRSAELDVVWMAVTGANGYRVRWKLAGADDWPAANRAEPADAGYTITGLTGGTEYDVEVTARVTAAGATVDGDSAEASATTHRALTGLTAAGVAGSSDLLDVAWMAVTGASGYRVQWKLTGAAAYPTPNRADIASGSTVTHQITGLSARTAYTVRVTARVTVAGATVDGGAAEANGSTESGAVGAVPDLAVAPVEASTSKLQVSWSSVADAAGYAVSWKDNSQSYDSARAQQLGSTVTSHTITGLTPNTEYTVRVDANDDSTPTAQLLARSETAATTHPNPTLPTGLSGSLTGNRAIPDFVLTQGQPGIWTLPQASGGDGALTYTLSPDLPAGIVAYINNDGESTLAFGRTTETQPATRYAWRATDEDGDYAELTFTIEIVTEARPITFGTQTVPDLYLTVGEEVDLLMPAATGNEPIEYLVHPQIGFRVGSVEDIGAYVLCPRSGCRLRGSARTAGVRELDLRAKYNDPVADATLKFTVHAAAEDLAPSFGDAAVSNQSWTQHAPVAGLTLPQATGGNGPLTHLLSPALPAGLSLDAGTRRITGTPTVTQAATEYTWRATDSDTMNPESAELTFTIEVPAATPGVTVSAASVTVAEADDTSTGNVAEHQASWTVRLTSDPGDGATVTVTPSSSAAGAAAVSGALAFTGGIDGDWNTPQTVTVTGVDDEVDNPGDRRTATVSHAVGGYGSVSEAPSVTVTVTDDDTAGVTFDRASVSVGEAGGQAAYTVVLDTEPTGEVTVTPSSSATDAATVSPAALTFTGGADGNWATPQTVTVTGVNDHVGGNRGATVSHTFAGGGYAAVTGTVAVTVTDDDPVIAPASLTIPEGRWGSIRFRLRKAPGPDERVGVSVNRISTAITLSGTHFGFNSPGERKWNEYHTVTVGAPENTATGDVRTTLTFVAFVGGSTRRDLLDVRNYRVTVKDNDGPAVNVSASAVTVAEADDTSTGNAEEHKGTWTVALNTDPGAGATVTVTPSSSATGTATVSGALTFTGGTDGDWDEPQTVTVTAVDDDVDNDPDRTATVSHAVTGYGNVTTAPSVTVTVTDDETPDTSPSFGAATVPDQSLIRNVTIAALVLPEAVGGEGTLTYSLAGDLPPGLSFDPATRRITGAPAALQEATEYTWTVTDGDGDTDSLTFDIAVAEPRRVLVTPTTLVFGEAGSATYTVALSRAPEGEVVVTPASADASVATVSGALLFTGGADGTWATPQAVRVTGVPETAMQRDRTTTITHSISGYGSATVPDVTVSTTDAASSPALVLSATAAEVAEDGGEGTWTVRLASVPSASVTVTLASSSTADATVSPASLTFDRTSWFRPRTVTVRGVDDDVDNDPDRTASVTHTASGSGSGYESVAAATVTVTLTDDDDVTFGQGTVADQYWRAGEAIPSLILPEATGGSGALTYSLTTEPALGWLSFDAPTRALSGTPAAAATATATLTAEDDHGAEAELSFDITVWTSLTFGTGSIGDLAYTRNAAVAGDVLPEAAGGVAPLTYAITPALPAGLSFDPATRTLSGTPSALHAKSDFTYKATDSLPGSPNEATLAFTIEVVRSLPPTFGNRTVPDFVASVGQARTLELPKASQGAGTLTYSISPPLPDGVSLDGHTLTLSPTTVQAATGYTYTVTDTEGRSAELTFTIEVVAEDLVPTFGARTAVEHLFIRGETIAVTLPAATGGNEPLTYVVLGGSPSGTSLDLGTLALTGTPSTVERATQTLTVRDLDQDEDELSWSYEVVDADLAPSFGNAAVADQSWTRNLAIAALTLPQATGGNGALSYSLEGTLPAGLSFDAATRRITGAPTATQAPAEYTWKVTDGDTVNPESVELTFTIEVVLPALADLEASPVAGKGAELTVSWAAWTGAEKYRVRWKTGSGAFGAGEETTGTSHTITGLAAGTAYTVEVTAIDTDADPDDEVARSEVGATTYGPVSAGGGLKFTVREFTADRLSIGIAAGEALAPSGVSGAGVLVLLDRTGTANGSWIEQAGDERSAGTARGTLGRGTVNAGLSKLTDDAGGDNARIGLFPALLSGGDTVGEAIEVVWQGTGWFDPAAVDSFSLVWQGHVQSTVGLSGQTVERLPAAVLDLAAASDTGASDTDDITSDNTPTIGLSGLSIGAKVTLTAAKGTLSEEIVIASAAAASRSETFETLEDGAWTVTAVQEADGKERSQSAPLVVTVDTAAPTVGVSRVGTDILAAGATDTLLIGFSEAVNGFAQDDIAVSAGTVAAPVLSTTDPGLYSATYTAPSPATGSATVRIAAGAASDPAGNESTASAVFGIDFEVPGVAIEPAAVTVDETDDADTGDTEEHKATWTVRLKTRPKAAVTVTPSVPAESAVTLALPGGASALTFTAADWSEAQTVTVTAVNDNLDNTGDARTATVSHAVAGTGSGYEDVTAADVTATVTDDDAPAWAVSVSPATITENGGTATVTVSTGGVTFAADRTIALTLGGTATENTDYTIDSKSLTLTAGQSSVTATVTGQEDTADDDGETVTVTATLGDATLGSAQTITIAEEVPAGVTVSATALTVDEADDTSTSDTAEHQATWTVVLNTDPGSGTTVTVTPGSSATGTATVSPSSLSFTGGASGTWNEPQTVTVTAVDDDLDNAGDSRTATVTHTVSGYTGVSTAGSVTVTVTDDDAPAWAVSVSPATIAENGGTSTVTVSTGEVTFAADRTIALTLGGTATENTDYTIDNKSLTLTAGQSSVTATVTGKDDTADDDDETVIVTAKLGDATLGSAQTITITDDDETPPGVTVSTTALTVYEKPETTGGTADYTVVLNTRPAGNVTVTPSSSDTAAATVSPASLTFSTSNWDQAQTVTVSGVHDMVDTPDRTATISHAVTGYGDVSTAPDVTVTVEDADIARITLFKLALTVAEGGTNTVDLRLDSKPTGDVTVAVTSADTDDFAVAPAELVFTPDSYGRKTVTVTGVISSTLGDRSANLNLSASGGGYDGVSGSLAVSVTDVPGATAPGVTIAGGNAVTEGTAASFTLTLSAAAPSGGLNVNVSVADAAGSDFLAAADEGARAVAVASGQSSATFTVPTTADTNDEPDGAVTATLAAGVNYTVGATSSASVTVNDDDETRADLSPTFGDATIGDRTWTQNAAVDFTLPEASGGDGTLTYSLEGTLPAGLTFSPTTRKISGRPTATQSATDYTYTVTDGDATDPDTASLTFRITVAEDTAPTFGASTIANKTYVQHRKITDLTLPEATGGNSALSYTLTGPSNAALPAGLEFDAATRKLTGTPTASQAATTYTYTVTDGDTSDPDSASLTFTIAITANAAPTFGANTIANQSYILNTEIDDLTLPQASGGDGTLTHNLAGTLPTGMSLKSSSGPSGLTFSLTGTPTATQAATDYIWRATDSDGDKVELKFTIAVTATAVNNAPEFGADSYSFSLAENDDGSTMAVSVGTVSATDADTGDTVSYSITAGNTGSVFSIGASTGAITYTGSGENYEGFQTPTSAFSLTVSASDGSASDTATVTVAVTDVAEPPGEPAPPTVTATANSNTSLDVSWAAPTNTGPAITSYDLRYRAGTTGGFTSGPQDQTGTTASITGLTAGTSYEVQVRATNAEGNSAWSDSGSGTTSTNTAPEFGAASYSFSLAENDDGSTSAVSVGTVSATDADTGDTVSYSIEAGNTGNVFSIGASDGAITYTGSGENYEGFQNPASAFSLTVRASDGNANADVTVTVAVTDVDEPPGTPDAPTVTATANSTTGLDVSWAAPANTGPAITGYDVRHRAGSSGDFTDGPQDVTSTSSAITDLDSGTTYQVQVRATNAEGDGPWSDSGTGTTADLKPTFGAETVSAQTWTQNTPITALDLPEATGGDGTLTYTLTPALPAGLSFDASTRRVSGTPTESKSQTEYTYTATDGDATAPDAVSLKFDVTVAADLKPTFGSETVSAQTWTQNTPITALELPEATGGDGALTYTLTPALPAGLTFDASTRQVSGTPTASKAQTEYTYTATDGDATAPDKVSLTFDITVAADQEPSFGDATIADQTWTQNASIETLSLPEATGGDGALTYTLTPALPAGLSFDASTRQVSGTPTASKVQTEYTYTATDSDATAPDAVSLKFDITVATNTAPTFGEASYSFSLAENADGSASAVSLGTVSATDTDAGDTVSYSITAGNTGNVFSIGASDGALTYTGGGEDYEAFDTPATAFSLTVRASDGTAHSDVTVTVAVTDVTETATVTISGLADASVAENTSWSATATASGGIGAVTWSKEGTDAADFTLDASTGALAMVARDYENPADGNTDNAYEVTVKATDADGNTASVSITVTVIDVAEPPGKPGAPSVSVMASSTTGLDVSWAAPANTGPAIASYDVRYRAGTTGDFTDGPQDVTSTSSAITDLQVGTTYQVQVRATNAEGDGPWSDSGAATINDTKPKWAPPPGYTFEYIYEPRVNVPFSLTFPPATGDGTLTYSLRPEAGAALPAGLYFHPGTRTLWGTPTTTMPLTGYHYTVTDGDGDTRTIEFAIAVIYKGQLVAQHHLIDDTLLVSWRPSTESGVTGYLIQWKTGAQQYSTTERSHTAGPKESSYRIGDLPLGVYTVRVTQQGGAGDGTSFEGTVTLHGWPGVVYVDPVAGDARAVDIEWETVSTAAGYVIQWKPASDSEYPEANRASVAAASLTWRTYTDPTTGEETSVPIHRVSDLQPDTKYDARVTVYTAAGSAAEPDGLSHESSGTTHGELTGLSVAAVAGETTKLDVSWSAPVTGVARFKVGGYRVQWKSGSGDYPEANEATVSTGTRHRITGLAAGTTYTVKVTVLGDWSGLHADGDSAEASGATARDGATGESAAPRFLVYHDPGAGAGAVERYDRAMALLRASGRAYTVRTVTGTGEVERLARVGGSVMPRFFLGDPTSRDWVSRPGSNNGGLRWLSSVLAQPGASSAPAAKVSVADARVREGDGATLDFAVTLDTASAATVTVDYATSDGTATAGADYTATSGTLAFAAGETSKTVSVAVLDDAHDEGEETLALTLSNPAGARIADGEATGTIVNTDPMPKAWLARAGRTIGGQVVDALASRLEEGGGESYGTVGGTRIAAGGAPVDAHEAETEPPWWDGGLEQDGEPRTMTAEELMLGTAFHLSSGENEAGGPGFAAWGRFARSGFESETDEVNVDGEVATGFLGADVEWERVLAGVLVSHSRSEGSYRAEGDSGSMESTLTGLYPYGRLALSERVSAWGLAGMGSGTLRLDTDGRSPMETGVTLRMGAVGVTGRVLDGTGAGGIGLDIKSDAMWVGMKSGATAGLVGSESDATRLRLILDGERTFALGAGATFTPSAGVGLRVDGGDAGTGAGVELGAGVRYAANRLAVEGEVRVLVAHEESGYEEWGASGTVRLEPYASGRGLSLSLAPVWGNASSGTDRLWSARDAGEFGPAGEFEPQGRLEAELGYGFGLPRAPGVVTPYVGLTVAEGETRTYRTGVRWTFSPDATLEIEAMRREGAAAAPEHAIGLRVSVRW